MVNSHLIDGLANVAHIVGPDSEMSASSLHEQWAPLAGEGLMKAIRLMFHGGDPMKPNSYEHYDPDTGIPALYRGYDDYMHSWIVDLIMRHAVGVRPGTAELQPLPLGVDIECADIPHPAGRMHVRNGTAEIEPR